MGANVGTRCVERGQSSRLTPFFQQVYYLKYTVDYTYDTKSIAPIDVAIIMAPDCSVSYSAIPAGNNNSGQGVPSQAPPGPEHLVIQDFKLPEGIELVRAIAHFHTGAINASLVVNGKIVCTSLPTYGTEVGVAGNEKGYLVAVSECLGDKAPTPHGSRTPLKLKKGDVLEVHG